MMKVHFKPFLLVNQTVLQDALFARIQFYRHLKKKMYIYKLISEIVNLQVIFETDSLI